VPAALSHTSLTLHASAGSLARTLGSAIQAVPHHSRVCACRRELKSTNAAKPQTTEHRGQRCTSSVPVESGTKFVSRLSVGNTNMQRQRVRGLAVKKIEDLSPPCSTETPSCVGGLQSRAQARCAQRKPLRSVALRGRRPKSALPNPSLKLRPNGVPPGPRGRVVYHRPHGPGVTPSVPA
jgi:hypothetical protein